MPYEDLTLPDLALVALEQPPEASRETLRDKRKKSPRVVDFDPLIFWWDSIPDDLRQVAIATGPQSNMHRSDYIGPEACRQCHQKNFEQRPHRRMSAKATEENVQGNFSGTQSISYLGGEATFYREDDGSRMKLV
jgi:hypothetical protein